MRVICVAFVLAYIVGAPTAPRAEDRPEPCPPHDWCGCWLATYLGIKDRKQWRELWVARNWASYGRPADGPAPGVIAVYAHAKAATSASSPRCGDKVSSCSNRATTTAPYASANAPPQA